MSYRIFVSLVLGGFSICSLQAAEKPNSKDGADSAQFLAASNQRRADAEQAVAAVKEKERALDVRAGNLERELENLAEDTDLTKDVQVAELASRISKAQESLKALEGMAKPSNPVAFTTLKEMLGRDRVEDARRQVETQIKTLRQGIAGMVDARRKKLGELLRANSDALKTVEEWDKLQGEKAALSKEFMRAQAVRVKVFAEEGRYVQSVNASMNLLPADVPVVKIPPPADAAERLARFQNRNSPEALRELGERFFSRMSLDQPGLEEVRKLVDAGSYGPALDAYKKYFFSRLMKSEDSGEGESETDPDGADDEQRDGEATTVSRFPVPVSAEKIEMALQGIFPGNIFDDPRKGKPGKVDLGPPGAINWVFAESDSGWQLPFCQQLGNPLELATALRGSYVLGGPKEHLIAWSEILDDWAMNWQRDVENSPLPIRNYNLLIVCRLEALREILATAARLRPSFVEDFPSTTLARLLMLANEEYLSSSIRLGRSGLYNLRVMALNSLMRVSLQMQEFHAHQWALMEGWRQVDDNFIYKIRRDGANFEFANDGHEDTDQSMIANMERLQALQKKPEWLEPYWDDEFREKFLSNTRYRVSNLKQDGFSYRLNTRLQYPRYAGEKPVYKVNLLADEPEVAQRMWSVFELGEPQDPPQILSESLPFQGYYYLRGGWKPDDYFLYFQSIGQPILSGREDNTGFMFYNHGQSMLLAPAVTVDGRVQNAHFGANEKGGGKSYYATYGLPDAVKTGRFLGGKHFDFCEGSFEGVYQYARPVTFFYPFGVYDWITQRGRAEKDATRAGEVFLNEPIKDVSQNRQILAVKGRDLFIVTDTVHSELPHQYTQNYTVYTPVRNDRPKERIQMLQEADVAPLQIDEQKRTLKTRNPGLPNLEMAHFSSFPVEYSVLSEGHAVALREVAKSDAPKAIFKGLSKREGQEAAINNEVLLNQKIAATWEGQGTQILVTLLATAAGSPEAGPAEILKDIQPLALTGEAAGFSARFADGTPITYVTHAKPSDVQVGALKAKASTLLLSGDRGVALDCTEIGGIVPVHSDFTFQLVEGKVVINEPIYRPIQPVVIEPVVNVFTESTEVTLKCATPGVEIRYTLDGSKPVPQSPLYTGPFTVNKTSHLKARAFRSGLTRDVWQADGTHATVVYSTVLRKEPLAPAVPDAEADRNPGLAYEYFEGPWTTLMARSLDMPAQKKGVVPDLLDVSPRETQGAFGIRYSGFLNVPTDGVYTFYAPREYTFPDIDSGYELRVFVDGKEWNPAVRWQGHGEWSVALQKGRHAFEVAYVDTRSNPRKVEFLWGFPDPSFTWNGVAPELSISGPGLTKQVVPAGMLSH